MAESPGTPTGGDLIAAAQLNAHLAACSDCVPSVMTADRACDEGKRLLAAYHAEMKVAADAWWEAHPEEWTYD